jgi:hypothetical protein
MMADGFNPAVLAIYLQRRGFAFAFFEGQRSLVDWGIHVIRADKAALSLARIDSMLDSYAPDVLVLEANSKSVIQRAPRIQELNARINELARQRAIIVRSYSKIDILEHFAAKSKHSIAETIARELPALVLYPPPPRKAWKNEDPRMGLFEAAALAWKYYDDGNGA